MKNNISIFTDKRGAHDHHNTTTDRLLDEDESTFNDPEEQLVSQPSGSNLNASNNDATEIDRNTVDNFEWQELVNRK